MEQLNTDVERFHFPHMKNKETLKQAGYTYAGFRADIRAHLLRDDSGKLEMWFANKNHSSYGLKWRNTHLEFARSL
jgi:hypothetical protein